MVGERLRRAAVLSISVLLLTASAAWADDISNNLDSTVDAVAEVMPLSVGGSVGTTQLYVVPQNGDGKQGCNLTGSTTLVVSVASTNALVATVTPTSVTFDSCGATPTLTVTPLSAGTTTISASQTSNNSDGTFDLAPVTFTVNVTASVPTNTAPSLLITGVTGGASYEIGSVPAATCQVTDAEDGNSSFAATLSAITGPQSAHGLGEQTASCTYTDHGGLTASASVTYLVVDTTAPVIAFHADVTAEATSASGALVSYTSPATSDAVDGAGVATCLPASGTLFALGATTVTCNATDAAGNHAISTTFVVHVRLQLKGFYQPVDMNGVWNTVKGGSTVPLKFEVFAGLTELTDTSVVDSFAVKGVACPGTGATTADIELTTTGGTTLRYDATAGQFIQNWQTPKKAGACYSVTMTTLDGSSLSALFKLK